MEPPRPLSSTRCLYGAAAAANDYHTDDRNIVFVVIYDADALLAFP